MKITDYAIAREDDFESTQKIVQDMIDSGWQPFGSVSVAMDAEGGRVYAQAMVIYEDEE